MKKNIVQPLGLLVSRNFFYIYIKFFSGSPAILATTGTVPTIKPQLILNLQIYSFQIKQNQLTCSNWFQVEGGRIQVGAGGGAVNSLITSHWSFVPSQERFAILL